MDASLKTNQSRVIKFRLTFSHETTNRLLWLDVKALKILSVFEKQIQDKSLIHTMSTTIS